MEYSTETEKKIISAATEVFIQKGRDGARMEEIARKAGLNKALLHYYFRSKEKLYTHVFASEVREFFNAFLNSVPVSENIENFLHGFINNYIDHLRRNSQVVRFIIWEIGQGGQMFVDVVSEVFSQPDSKTPQFFIRKIEQAVKEGKIRPLDPFHLLLSMIGMSIFIFIAQPLVESIFPVVQVSDPAFIEKRKDEIFQLIWQGVQP